MPNTPLSNMSAEYKEALEERILGNSPFGQMMYGFKTVRPERMSDKVVFKRFHKPIFERIIDLAVFYERVTAKSPKELYVGAEEWREIMQEQRDVDYIGRSHGHLKGMLGMFNGMAVFRKHAKHHLECI